MVNFGDVGRICLNQEINGVCENCLWWEWDSQRQQCSNCQYHVCPLYRERLFSAVSQARSRRILRLIKARGLQAPGQMVGLSRRGRGIRYFL